MLPQRPIGSSVFFRTVLMSIVNIASSSPVTEQASAVFENIACFLTEKRIGIFPFSLHRVIWHQMPFLFCRLLDKWASRLEDHTSNFVCFYERLGLGLSMSFPSVSVGKYCALNVATTFVAKTAGKWRKCDLVSGMASVASDMGCLWTGWIGPAPVQMSGMLSGRRAVVIVCCFYYYKK